MNDDRDEVPHDDTSDQGSIASQGSDESDADSISLAATENELLEKVREWFYCVLGGLGLVITLFIGISVYFSQRGNLKSAFYLLSPESISLKHQITVLEHIAVERVRGAWPNAIASHLELSEWLDQTSVLPVVYPEEKLAYEAYSVAHAEDWLGHGLGDSTSQVAIDHRRLIATGESKIHAQIYNAGGGLATNRSFYLPLWQTVTTESPNVVAGSVNLDILSTSAFNTDQLLLAPKLGVPIYGISPLKALASTSQNDTKAEPWIPIIRPVNSESDDEKVTVALILGFFSWRHLLPSGGYLSMDVESTCGGNQTHFSKYRGSNGVLEFAGTTLEAPKPFYVRKSYQLNGTIDKSGCTYTFHLSPSAHLQNQYITYAPLLYPAMVFGFVALVCLMFHGYDVLVEERQKIVVLHSTQANAILSSLFPRQVRERLMRRNSNASEGLTPVAVVDGEIVEAASSHRIKHFLSTSAANGAQDGDSPIADLFPNCTGFTAWSSLRDPSQVFKLLEAVYSAFDAIARRRGVFKVETIGDSYVCVTGLPDPQREHALIMGRFARDCRTKFKDVTRKLELSLGPDTGDLCMRFGMHSGPVTAGVLRGEKSRFQLFGDTVNTAARMESTGVRDCIQVSQSTADLLIDGGKGYWLRPRDIMVHAKGKGEMQTFWIDPSSGKNRNSSLSSGGSDASHSQKHLGESPIWGIRSELADVESQRNKHQRLIDYNVDLLTTHLKCVVARRKATERFTRRGSSCVPPLLDEGALSTGTRTVLDEVVPVIRLPQFDANAFKKQLAPESIELPDAVKVQLKRYVTVIAAMYRQNPFHNWEHASHVVLSVNKLLQRVVAPEIRMRRRSVHTMDANEMKRQVASDLHMYTHGITSDPLTQFAIIFAAMIHDLDHYGVSNSQLIKENSPIATKYRHKSVAEQNSVDLAWDLLMDKDEYGDFQQCIFSSESEFKRFRQVVCNLVMATDIFDAELQALRKDRWEKAFREEANFDDDHENRKATIVIEHIMQASDVAHTMQHWHIYQKWNRRLFDELYTAYRSGRMEVDPSTFWYEGELKFFDGYIIPLAKKLKDCNVFGVASDECLNYALDNRREWANKGENIVQELLSSFVSRESEEQGEETKKRSNRFARRRSLMTSGG